MIKSLISSPTQLATRESPNVSQEVSTTLGKLTTISMPLLDSAYYDSDHVIPSSTNIEFDIEQRAANRIFAGLLWVQSFDLNI